MKLKPHNMDVIQKRFEQNSAYLKGTMAEVTAIVGCDEDSLGVFYGIFCMTCLFYNPEAIKKEQEQLVEAKILKSKISKKSLELSKLLDEFADIELSTCKPPPRLHTLDILSNAATYSLEKGNGYKHQKLNFDVSLKPTIENVLSKDEPYEHCPEFSSLLLALREELELFEFGGVGNRQSSVRSMVAMFISNLIDCVLGGKLPSTVIDISSGALAQLTNIALDLKDDETISEESVGKAINKAINDAFKDN